MPKERSEIEAGLERKGFVKDDQKDHNYFVYHDTTGKRSRVKTKTSHGSKYKTLDDSLISMMARQCKLTKGQFIDLVDCPLSREAYEGILRKNKSL